MKSPLLRTLFTTALTMLAAVSVALHDLEARLSAELMVGKELNAGEPTTIFAGEAQHMRGALAERKVATAVHRADEPVIANGVEPCGDLEWHLLLDDDVAARGIAEQIKVGTDRLAERLGKERRPRRPRCWAARAARW